MCLATLRIIQSFRESCKEALQALSKVRVLIVKQEPMDEERLEEEELLLQDAMEAIESVDFKEELPAIPEISMRSWTPTKKPRKIKLKRQDRSGYHERVPCDVCGKMVRKWLKKQHIKLSHPAQEVMCTSCSKMFPTEKNLRQHIRHVHLTDKDKFCKVCHRFFPDMSDEQFKAHIADRDLHLKMCSICGKKMLRNTLSYHIKSTQ